MTTTQARTELTEKTLGDPRWASVVSRDGSADASFVYSVSTTGVYCRPSCGARRALPENVAFYPTPGDAEQAGFRACKRCKPNEDSASRKQAEMIASACKLIEQSATEPSLSQLARRARMSESHFHRTFKAVTGVSPKRYAVAHRTSKVRRSLNESPSITEAIYDSGFNSSSRFYERSNGMLGMTPSSFKAGGVETRIFFAVGETSLGSILVAKTDRGVCAVLLGDDPEVLLKDLQAQFPNAELVGGDPSFEDLVSKVVGFVEAPQTGLDLPLDIRGTAFQQRVWKALQDIPLGQTASYSEIARQIGAPRSVRAVAQACAANLLALAIPCHRVIKHNGEVSGYRWGVDRKRALLGREALV